MGGEGESGLVAPFYLCHVIYTGEACSSKGWVSVIFLFCEAYERDKTVGYSMLNVSLVARWAFWLDWVGLPPVRFVLSARQEGLFFLAIGGGVWG